MGVYVYRSSHLGALADQLAHLLNQTRNDPFVTDWIVCPPAGITQWLSQRLSWTLGADQGHDGICTAIQFHSLEEFVDQLSVDIVGTEPLAQWHSENLRWSILHLLDENPHSCWAQALGTTKSDWSQRRYRIAHQLSELFCRYRLWRPQMLQAWESGQNTNGFGQLLSKEMHWQPALWRHLLTHDHRESTSSPSQIQTFLNERLHAGPHPKLPRTVSFFGHFWFGLSQKNLLRALATHHDLYLWIPHPCPQLWKHELCDDSFNYTPLPRSDHQRLIQILERGWAHRYNWLTTQMKDDCFIDSADHNDILLAQIQHNICDAPLLPNRQPLTDQDQSIQLHCCYGYRRQVEVLRDILLDLFATHPDLSPHEIIIFCPNMARYSPLLQAIFGTDPCSPISDPARELRIELAGYPGNDHNEFLHVIRKLVALSRGRADINTVMQIAQLPVITQRFRFSQEDHDYLRRWISQANVRWGFDAEHHHDFGLGMIYHNSWQFGLDRLLLGVVLSEHSHQWIDTAAPVDAVGSAQIELLGRFSEFISRLHQISIQLQCPHSIDQWRQIFYHALEQLTISTDQTHRQLLSAHHSLDQLTTYSHQELTLSPEDIYQWLEQHLHSRMSYTNYCSGTLLVCPPGTLRAVPHRIVCFLGLDDWDTHQSPGMLSDDLLQQDPHPGEYDYLDEQHQLFVDELLAARDKVIITYCGYDEHTGTPLPAPSLLVALEEYLNHCQRPEHTNLSKSSKSIVHHLTHVHPLHSLDEKNFTTDSSKSFHFRAYESPSPTPSIGISLLEGQHLNTDQVTTIELDQLIEFMKDPLRGFFRHICYALPHPQNYPQDNMTVDLDPLSEWIIGQRMLTGLLAGIDIDVLSHLEWRQGILPPGKLGMRTFDPIRQRAHQLAYAASQYGYYSTSSSFIDFTLPNNIRLSGTINGIDQHRLVMVSYSKLKAKVILSCWISLLCLATYYPHKHWQAICIGRDPGPYPDRLCQRAWQAPSFPQEYLHQIVSFYQQGHHEPLLFPLETSYAWAQARQHGEDPYRAAQHQWRRTSSRDGSIWGECRDIAQQCWWGSSAPFDVLLSHPARDPYRYQGETSRLGALAMQIWTPILNAEMTPQ